jgi:hypothetical protein
VKFIPSSVRSIATSGDKPGIDLIFNGIIKSTEGFRNIFVTNMHFKIIQGILHRAAYPGQTPTKTHLK